jgi:hypothetical protein
MVRESDINVPLIEPFANEYEGVSLKNLGLFLNKFCKSSNTMMRGVFIVLDAVDGYNTTL